MSFSKLEKKLAPEVRALLSHPLYAELKGLGEIRALMETHVFAVWDFMSLVKTLQRDLTCVDVPWLPPADPVLSRFVNEIVLGEESDEVGPGVHISHCELYLRAMDDVGADRSAFDAFLKRLRRGIPLRAALAHRDIPEQARRFTAFTLATAKLPTHRVAASFLYGRESVIPGMFRKILREVGAQKSRRLANMSLYLDRHIALDGDNHGPMARRLLIAVCGNSPKKWREAEETARAAIRARLALWDGVLAGILVGRP